MSPRPQPLTFSSQRVRQLEYAVLKIVLAVVLVTALGSVWLGWSEGWQAFNQLTWVALGVLLAATIVENLLRLYRYHIFSNALRLPVRFRWLALYYCAGMALIPTPGKIGTALRLWLLKTHHNLPYTRTAPLLIVDIVTDLLAMSLLFGLGLLMLPHVAFTTLGVLWMLGLTATVGFVMQCPTHTRRLLKLGHRLTGRRWPRMLAKINQILTIIQRQMGWSPLLQAAALSFVSWSLLGFALTFLLHQAGAMVPWSTGPVALCASTVLGVVSLLPGGLGGAEASLAAILHAFGTPFGLALVATVLARVAVLWLPVAVGFAVLPWALKGPVEKKK